MKRILAVFLALILIFSAVSFSAFADDTVSSGAGYIPPHPYYSPGVIKGTTGGGTKEDPIIVDTFDELKKALEFPLDGLYIRCDTCAVDSGGYISAPSPTAEDLQSGNSTYSTIKVKYDKTLTLDANLDVRSSRIDAPLLESVIRVQAYLKIEGTGSIAGTFTAGIDYMNTVFDVSSPGVLEICGITVEGANRENGVTPDTYAEAIISRSGGTLLIHSGTFIGRAHPLFDDSICPAVSVGGSHAVINGGTFRSYLGEQSVGLSVYGSSDVILAGGTFSGFNSTIQLSDLLKSGFVYKNNANNASYSGVGVKKTAMTLRVDYAGSGLRPTEQLSSRQIPGAVGFEYLHFTPPDDNTWYDSPVAYSIDGNSDRDYVGNACYLDFAGVDAEAYDLYDKDDQLMRQQSWCSFTASSKPIRIKYYLTASKNNIFSKNSVIVINEQIADLQIINGKQAIASVPLTYTDSNQVVDNIALKGSFVPTPGLSAISYNGKLDQYINCDDGKCEVTNSWIGESGRYDTKYTGTLVAGNTYYMWFVVTIYDPYIYGVDLTYSFYDSTGKSNPSSYNKNYGSLMGQGGSVEVSVPFIVPAQNADPMISGTVTSYLSSTDTVTIQLLQGTTVKKSTTVKGNTASYSITNVPVGTYTLRVTKKNHTPRDYTVKINGANQQNVTINPIGDANLNGSVTSADANAVYKHVLGSKKLTDPYAIACGDVVGNNNGLTSADSNSIYKHVLGTKKLY